MTPGQARVVDPVLSTVAQGYQNADLVWTALFPVVPVDVRGGRILTFGKEAFRIYNTGRSPGQDTKRIQVGHAGDPFVLEQHALEGVLPIENQQEAAATTPGIDLGGSTATTVQDIIQLRTEYAAATLATNLANYPAANKRALSGSDKWTDPSSTPSQDIEAAKEVIRAATGKRPDTALLSAKSFSALQNNPSILDRIKYTGRDSITVEMLAALWNLRRVVVGDAVHEDASGNLVDVWGADVVLSYSAVGSVPERGRPTFGYTYRLRGYPIVEQPYYDRQSKSWIYPVTDELQPVIAGSGAGYLLKGVV
jgi:hypothetical protein